MRSVRFLQPRNHDQSRAPLTRLPGFDQAAPIRRHARPRCDLNPSFPVSHYHDLFRNTCLRMVAPVGGMTIWSDASIEDEGKIDRADVSAREAPMPEQPDDRLVYLIGICL